MTGQTPARRVGGAVLAALAGIVAGIAMALPIIAYFII